MGDDDLGKRVTQVPGFKWRDGMGYSAHGVFKTNGVYDDIAHSGWRSVLRLDLDHPANTGFLLELWECVSDSMVCVEYSRALPDQGVGTPGGPWYTGETVNHALARAIIAASEEAAR